MAAFIIFTAEQSAQIIAESENSDFRIVPRKIDKIVDGIEDDRFVAPIEVLSTGGSSWMESLPTIDIDPANLFTLPSY